MNLRYFLFVTFSMVFQVNVHALEISTWSTAGGQVDPAAPWILKGEIEQGDLARLKAAIVKTGVLPKSVMLDSPGGDINEAINIGLFFRSALIRYRSVEDLEGNAVSAECSSACALIFFSTLEKHIHINSKTRIGLHKPFFDREYLARLDSQQAANQYQRAERTLRTHLSELLVPDEVVDVMFSTEPASTRYFSDLGLAQWQPAFPAYDAWKNAHCNTQPSGEQSKSERNHCLVELETTRRQELLNELLVSPRN